MSTTMTTTSSSLGTSHLRGSSSKTRSQPLRVSRNARPSQRQASSLAQSNLSSAHGHNHGQSQAHAHAHAHGTNHAAPLPDTHGFYPAITHFTDAIVALPRDFRRHTSLLKEVDAKAWAVEENIQKLLADCLQERQMRSLSNTVANTVAGSTCSVAGDIPPASTAGSVVGNATLDTASQVSANIDQDLMRRRRLYAELRQNLMQAIMPLDEKNHVINNANDELSRHIRRQDEIWPHIADEISEETRLGSLKHWALTDLNPVKKAPAVNTRGREAVVPDNEVAERSERRREAMALAKKQKTAAAAAAAAANHVDSEPDFKKTTRKPVSSKKAQEADDALAASVNLIGQIPGMKVNKPRAAPAKKLEDAPSKKGPGAGSTGGVSMSRENSQHQHQHQNQQQQQHSQQQQQQQPLSEGGKKRKAPTAPVTVARKRINATVGESPKLANSPLAGTFGKDVKKSPALSQVKPVGGRGRTGSLQSETASTRQPSASRRNGVTVGGVEMERVMSATGKTAREVRQTMKETVNSKGEKMLEEDVPDSVENRIRGGIALERSASKSSQLKKDDATVGRRTASPRLTAAAAMVESGKPEKSKSRSSKTNTPVMGTFTDPTESESAPEASSTMENGAESGSSRTKRPVRPRIKDHHGLHDSLSPKGLPTKRAHKHKGSYSLSGSFTRSNTKEDEPDRKPSRTNSRQKKDESSHPYSHRNADGKIVDEMVDEPESMHEDSEPVRPAVSRRTSQNPRKESATPTLDVKPPARTAAASTALNIAMSPDTKDEPLGSPGPDLVDDMEPELEDGDEDDPNETRYCYCGGVSYGEMVACDNENCSKEWFHLECTGLRALPPSKSTWYCDDCKKSMAR